MDTTDPAVLIERLRTVERIEACRRAVADYCHAVDLRDEPGIADHFAAEAEYGAGVGALWHGRDEIVSQLRRILAASPPGQHFVTNQTFEVVGDRVHSQVSFLRLRYSDDLDLATGRYVDVFEFDDDGTARCTSKQVHITHRLNR